MTAIRILKFLHLLSYFVIASQLTYYLVIMGDALKMVSIENFIEQRKIVDPMVHQRHVPFYYACMGLSLLLLFLTHRQWNTSVFFTTAIATVLLLADVAIALKVNGPINSLINQTSAGASSVDWEALRTEWIKFIRLRALISMTGFILLLAGLVFSRR